MSSIPDWVWKLISLCVVPLFVWVWNTHSSVTVVQQEVKHIEKTVIALDKDVEELKDMEITIAVMQRDIAHISENIEELTKLMSRIAED